MQKNITQQIMELTLLKSLTIEEIKNYLNTQQLRLISYKRNSIVHLEGEQCTKLDIIISGEVVVERICESGSLMTVSSFYKNDLVGGNILFSKKPFYPMTITTKQQTLILEISKDLLFILFKKYEEILAAYLEFISDNALILSDKIKHFINKSIRESIIAYLNHERRIQKTPKVKLSMSKKMLAEKMGIQRTSLSRELKKMKLAGLINYDRTSITIIDIPYY